MTPNTLPALCIAARSSALRARLVAESYVNTGTDTPESALAFQVERFAFRWYRQLATGYFRARGFRRSVARSQSRLIVSALFRHAA